MGSWIGCPGTGTRRCSVQPGSVSIDFGVEGEDGRSPYSSLKASYFPNPIISVPWTKGILRDEDGKF